MVAEKAHPFVGNVERLGLNSWPVFEKMRLAVGRAVTVIERRGTPKVRR